MLGGGASSSSSSSASACFVISLKLLSVSPLAISVSSASVFDFFVDLALLFRLPALDGVFDCCEVVEMAEGMSDWLWMRALLLAGVCPSLSRFSASGAFPESLSDCSASPISEPFGADVNAESTRLTSEDSGCCLDLFEGRTLPNFVRFCGISDNAELLTWRSTLSVRLLFNGESGSPSLEGPDSLKYVFSAVTECRGVLGLCSTDL
eukprot:NODE_97_length_21155_cov_0.234850.p11 type:complete len:207 gc:universal NODE_97_length_21155_cov_0.234850:17722-17102(-)